MKCPYDEQQCEYPYCLKVGHVEFNPTCAGKNPVPSLEEELVPAVDEVINAIRAEVFRAMRKHPKPFNSYHEGWAVIYEEFVKELGDEVFKSKPDRAHLKEEAVQTAAMAVRFMVDLLR